MERAKRVREMRRSRKIVYYKVTLNLNRQKNLFDIFLVKIQSEIVSQFLGRLAERLNAAVLKTVKGVIPSRVRILHLPPNFCARAKIWRDAAGDRGEETPLTRDFI